MTLTFDPARPDYIRHAPDLRACVLDFISAGSYPAFGSRSRAFRRSLRLVPPSANTIVRQFMFGSTRASADRLLGAPGPPGRWWGWPLAFAGERSPLAFMTDLVRTHGDVVQFRINGHDHVLLAHPDDIKGVLLTHYANFLKGRGLTRTGQFLGNSVIVAERDQHKDQRRVMQPSFHRQCYADYGRVMAAAAVESSDSWQTGQALETQTAMRRIATTIIFQTMFSSEPTDYAARLSNVLRQTAFDDFTSFKLPYDAAWLRLKIAMRGRKRSPKVIAEAMTAKLLSERRGKPPNGDLLSLLLEAGPSDGMGDDGRIESLLLDEIVTIFVAGHETTSQALAWAWHLLALNPDVEARLHAEVDRVLGSRRVTADDYTQLPYAEGVITESLRLYPPVWRLMRYAIRDYPIRDYVARARSLIIVSPYLTQHDERFFPDPLRFDPDRWAPEARAARHPFAFFPFGGGHRRCLGDGFAFLEGVMVLATLVQRWRFRPIPGRPVVPKARAVLNAPDGIWLELEERR